MNPRSLGIALRGLALTGAFVLLLARPGAAQPIAAPTPPLGGALLAQTKFPDRAFLLSDPSNVPLTATQVTVTENGHSVSSLSVKRLMAPGRDDFGAMLVIDQSTEMSGTLLSQAMDAARSLAARRSGYQKLGVVTYDAAPNLLLAPTSNAQRIWQVLGTTPWVGPGARALPALELSIQTLTQARVATGAVILIANGVGDRAYQGVSPEALAAVAQAHGIRLFIVGLKDRHLKPHPLAQLAARASATFVQATPEALGSVVGSLWSSITRHYLVRYRSGMSLGRQVAVRVAIAGVPGSVSLAYATPPKPPTAPKPPPAPGPHPPPWAPHPKPVSLPAPALPAGPSPARSFWDAGGSVVGVALLCGLLVGIAVALMLLRRPSRRAVQARVGIFIPFRDATGPEDGSDGQGWVGRRIVRRRWWPEFVEQVKAARFKRAPLELAKRALWSAIGAGVLLAVVTGTVFVGLLPLAVAPVLLRYVVRRAARRQRLKFIDQLPSHLQDMAGAMRAGRSIVGAMSAVAEAAEEPIRGELERALADERLGLPVEATLEAMAKRMASEDIEQVALIAGLHRRSGSNVAEALDRIAEGARERADMRRELAALTGQARISSWILTALPPVLLVAASLIDPNYAKPMFHTAGGIVVLCICALMVISGWFVMRRIIDIEV